MVALISAIVEQADERVSIWAVARRYGLRWGVETGRARQVLCPLHEERNPSARVYPNNSGYCWTCQRAFTPTSLVSHYEGVSRRRAAELLAEWFGVDLSPDQDEETLRALLAQVERGEQPADLTALRRAASSAVRVVGLPWEQAARMLDAYDLLDCTDMDPRAWITFVRESVTQ